jgi:hypothetical protein
MKIFKNLNNNKDKIIGTFLFEAVFAIIYRIGKDLWDAMTITRKK